LYRVIKNLCAPVICIVIITCTETVWSPSISKWHDTCIIRNPVCAAKRGVSSAVSDLRSGRFCPMLSYFR
jgi:hypothetical protein